jgi:hypothetical protein
MARRGIAMIAATGFAALLTGEGVCRADALDPALIGVWAPSGPDCARVFERRGAALAFRRPIDNVTPATIIRPEEIVLASGACRVQGVSHVSGAFTVKADCNDAASSAAQTLQIRLRSAGEILFNPTGDPARDARLIKCRFDPGAPGPN